VSIKPGALLWSLAIPIKSSACLMVFLVILGTGCMLSNEKNAAI